MCHMSSMLPSICLGKGKKLMVMARAKVLVTETLPRRQPSAGSCRCLARCRICLVCACVAHVGSKIRRECG